MKARKGKPRAGRKPKGPFAGNSARLTTRLPPDLRRGLEREAKRSGRSLSQEVCLRLQQSLDAPKMADRAFGNDRNKALAVLVAKLATWIEFSTGCSWREDRYTFEALAHALPILLDELSPSGPVTVPERIRVLVARDQRLANQEQPRELGISNVLGLITALRMHREPPPIDYPANERYADEFFQFPKIRADLGLNGDDQ